MFEIALKYSADFFFLRRNIFQRWWSLGLGGCGGHCHHRAMPATIVCLQYLPGRSGNGKASHCSIVSGRHVQDVQPVDCKR